MAELTLYPWEMTIIEKHIKFVEQFTRDWHILVREERYEGTDTSGKPSPVIKKVAYIIFQRPKIPIDEIEKELEKINKNASLTMPESYQLRISFKLED